jgi:hypothetical protein
MLRAWKPQRPPWQDCAPLLIEWPCPACYYSKEQASWKCYEHRHGGSSLLLQMQFMLYTTSVRKKTGHRTAERGLKHCLSIRFVTPHASF